MTYGYFYDNDKEIVVAGGNIITIEKPNTDGMLCPVECPRCGKVFDLCDVKSEARYADCDTFTTPCCQFPTDTRKVKKL